MDKQNKVTISICVTPEIAEQLETISTELGLSKSGVATAMLTTACKWCNLKSLKQVMETAYGKR